MFVVTPRSSWNICSISPFEFLDPLVANDIEHQMNVQMYPWCFLPHSSETKCHVEQVHKQTCCFSPHIRGKNVKHQAYWPAYPLHIGPKFSWTMVNISETVTEGLLCLATFWFRLSCKQSKREKPAVPQDDL